MDTHRLYLRDLELSCVIGCNPEERFSSRPLILNVVLELLPTQACQTDRLEDTVDYSLLSQTLIVLAKNSSYFTIERLAQDLLETCERFHPGIVSIDLDLEKPGCIAGARSAGIRISRQTGLIRP